MIYLPAERCQKFNSFSPSRCSQSVLFYFIWGAKHRSSLVKSRNLRARREARRRKSFRGTAVRRFPGKLSVPGDQGALVDRWKAVALCDPTTMESCP